MSQASGSKRSLSGPAGVRTVTGLSANPLANAAAAAPVEPVPELLVSPAPRSQKRTSMVWRSTLRTNETLVRFGKARVSLHRRAHRAPVEIEVVHRENALRIARVDNHRIEVLNLCGEVDDADVSHIHLELELELVPRDHEPEVLDAGAGPDDENRFCRAGPSQAAAAAHRVPLPEISGSLPSELKRRMDASNPSPAGAVEQHPAIGAHAGIAVADGDGDFLKIGDGHVLRPS